MQDEKVTVPSSISVRNVRFQSNVDFQKSNQMRDADAAFLRYRKRSWMQPKGDAKVTREVIATLLASTESEECVDDCIEKLLAEEISYNDLGSLTHIDLELMGFRNAKQRDELVAFLRLLPNQDPSYDGILKLDEAANYNCRIFNSATSHLEAMCAALSVANYKLKIMPADDVVVGEKSFASRFVIEALAELKGITDEIDAQLCELDELVTGIKNKSLRKKKANNYSNITVALWILMSSIAAGTLAAIWLWKRVK